MRSSVHSILIGLVVVGGVVLACGSDDAGVEQPPGTDAGGSSSGDVDGSTDGSSGGVCGDTYNDPNNCGACGTRCSDDKFCAKGACVCPPYTADCGAGCKPVVSDAANCGGCGKTCTTPQVCAGGGCADSCLPGTTPCAGACVDTGSDNNNCGGCGTKCAAGQGCVDGQCRAAVALAPSPTPCTNGGAPIVIGTAPTDPCAGTLATKTFTWALCSCTNVQLSGVALIDGFDSSIGPYKPGQLGAGMGYNGSLSTSSSFDIWGTMWGSASTGFNTNAASTVRFDLRSGGNVKTAQFSVENDARVNGNVEGTPFTVAKKLYVPAGATLSGVTAQQTINGAVSVPPPCACEAKDILPIAGIVDAKATANDNAKINLDPNVLDKPSTQTRFDLPCGQYYLSKIDTSNAVTIVTQGRTALYIGGDIKNGAALTITPAPGSELDVIVKGTLLVTTAIKIGSANYPAATRVYVGGGGDLNFAANATVGANIYAPNANFQWGSATAIFGSVFAGNFKSNSALNIHYDRAVVNTFQTCPQAPPSGGGGSSGNPPPSGCGSCRDCNNQACVNGKCDSCADSSQCCSPLVCVGGSCVSPIR